MSTPQVSIYTQLSTPETGARILRSKKNLINGCGPDTCIRIMIRCSTVVDNNLLMPLVKKKKLIH